ncbi:uncharacterized protein PHALS_00512 [Plasmopara halstedii]|uniref:Uncharacterized protein n=1 Tax=Plasmopara halstedii TaxID=4781 RepID=A0A0P1A7T7_PLAHL|nr:uncharacterized protein PHALS_00512 [Plasmopara halstedii]CEG36190.1 hypothetical protein PHALS_00512 [Plasmopara halstedii]|eukprot:XP_024572559.1 hypothetical protein PHALS_00512 [Plasmopara halstedii]
MYLSLLQKTDNIENEKNMTKEAVENLQQDYSNVEEIYLALFNGYKAFEEVNMMNIHEYNRVIDELKQQNADSTAQRFMIENNKTEMLAASPFGTVISTATFVLRDGVLNKRNRQRVDINLEEHPGKLSNSDPIWITVAANNNLPQGTKMGKNEQYRAEANQLAHQDVRSHPQDFSMTPKRVRAESSYDLSPMLSLDKKKKTLKGTLVYWGRNISVYLIYINPDLSKLINKLLFEKDIDQQGKNNLVFYILKHSPSVFSHLHIIARNTDQELYNHLRDKLGEFVSFYDADNVPLVDDICKSKGNGLE